MVMEALVYILTLLFGVSTVIIIKNKRYKVVPFICLDIILTFAGFAITSFVILFVGNEALEALLIMSVFGLFLFLLGVNDIYAVFCCNQKIEAIYCGYNSYPGRYGITSYAPVFGYVCNGTAYHEQTTLTVPYRLLRRMTEGNTYPIYIHSKHPGVCVLKRRIRFTTVIEFGYVFGSSNFVAAILKMVHRNMWTMPNTGETGKSVETLRFAEMLSSFAQFPGDVDSTA